MSIYHLVLSVGGYWSRHELLPQNCWFFSIYPQEIMVIGYSFESTFYSELLLCGCRFYYMNGKALNSQTSCLIVYLLLMFLWDPHDLLSASHPQTHSSCWELFNIGEQDEEKIQDERWISCVGLELSVKGEVFWVFRLLKINSLFHPRLWSE